MLVYDFIKKKRDGGRLKAEEVQELLRGYVDGSVADYQMAAYLMAVFFRGMGTEELAHWTTAMIESGERITFTGTGPYLDKHSTGGVGDKVSLPLAPLAACLGVHVPMVSGRGLGHTGGTLDKLESIPGYQTRLTPDAFRRIVDEVGCSIVGQTQTLVPADRKLYALRDVTATVDSIPLIASSILSKKVASGISGLVMDVKVGTGAFMTTLEDAEALASTLVDLGQALGLRVRSYLTEMSQPLGVACGNAIEVEESIDVLRGAGPEDVRALVVEFAAAMAHLGGTAPTLEDALESANRCLADGSALARFAQMIERQGGNPEVTQDTTLLPKAAQRMEVSLGVSGTIRHMDSERIGKAVVALGGGRRRMEDPVDPAVGLLIHKRIGDRLEPDEPAATILYNDGHHLAEALDYLKSGYVVGQGPVSRPALIKRTIG